MHSKTDPEHDAFWSGGLYLPPAIVIDAEEQRTPFQCNMVDVATTFGTSEERRKLVHGLLRFRRELADAGIHSGFQWVNGSFTENVEASRGRPPEDIDLVTFFELPEKESQDSFFNAHPHLFDRARVRAEHHVDSYWQPLGLQTDANTVHMIGYWHAQWSHSREGTWKGFLSVPLNPDADDAAESILASGAEDAR